jgi:hypothetical protein
MSGPDSISGDAFRRPAPNRADRPVELWLREALLRAYDEVLHEKVPESWLVMIGRAGRDKTGP